MIIWPCGCQCRAATFHPDYIKWKWRKAPHVLSSSGTFHHSSVWIMSSVFMLGRTKSFLSSVHKNVPLWALPTLTFLPQRLPTYTPGHTHSEAADDGAPALGSFPGTGSQSQIVHCMGDNTWWSEVWKSENNRGSIHVFTESSRNPELQPAATLVV